MTAFEPAGGKLIMLIVSNGMDAGKLAALIDHQKSESKNAGAHKTRQLLWNAYGALGARLAGVEGGYAGFLKYAAGSGDDDGDASLEPFTKRQAHALSQGGLELMGRKLRPLEEPDSKQWMIAFCGADAQAAYDDITSAEACVTITSAACFVGTRLKRRHCKNVAGLKQPKDVEKFLEDVKPALQSVAWQGSAAPQPNGYNTLLAGPGFAAPLLAALPDAVGHSPGGAPSEVYDAFLARRSGYYVAEAEKLLDAMEADMGKGGKLPLVVATIKEASCARKNCLLKRAYVHESKSKFIDAVRADGGDVELFVVSGDIKDTRFQKFGGVVAEMFYRADLTVYG
mmetsp:Transcript_28611/g.85483  ORF Transcript_28611/g.85483 Transcript_28611/m.85483 type:complete len:341 (+) Transcript_28611:134-1156(+)